MKQKDHKISRLSKSFWLFLHPYVYTSVKVKTENAILYNTLNGKLLEYDDKKVVRIIKKLNSDLNLYVIKLKENEIDESISKFINDIRDFYMGDIIDTKYRPNRPVQLKPMLNVQYTFDDLITGNGKVKLPEKDELVDCLSVITLFINNSCYLSCPMCKSAYKQFLCCFKGLNGLEEINLNDINQFIYEISNSKLVRINITGGNILHFSRLNELVELLSHVNTVKNYVIHYQNVVDQKESIEIPINEKNFLEIIIHFPINNSSFEQCLDLLKPYQLNVKFKFIVEEENQIDISEELISNFRLERSIIVPHFNKTNIAFFEECVFLNIDSIIESKPTMRDIFSRMILNTADFQKITILSNNKIYASLNDPPIGKMGRDNIYDLIYRQLIGGKSWTKVRRHVNPCKSCVFNALCPPISNYEYAIGRYNLCDIW